MICCVKRCRRGQISVNVQFSLKAVKNELVDCICEYTCLTCLCSDSWTTAELLAG